MKKILWAVDAIPGDPDIQLQGSRGIRALLEREHATIQPVYVAKPLPLAFFAQGDLSMENSLFEQAKKNLTWLTNLLGLPNVIAPHFVTAKSPNVGSQVKTLLEYAEKEKFDLIVVGTHARKGVPRFVLGSFSEKLILESRLPVLTANPNMSSYLVSKVKHILFPTDFSEASKEVFANVVTFAKELGAELTVFHQEESLYPAMGYVLPSLYAGALEDIKGAWTRQGNELVDEAKAKGVRASFNLERLGQSPSMAIVSAAESLPSSMIAIASQSNALESAILGSVTRQVVRAAPCPVYVIHPTRKVVSDAKPFFEVVDSDLPGPKRALLS